MALRWEGVGGKRTRCAPVCTSGHRNAFVLHRSDVQHLLRRIDAVAKQISPGPLPGGVKAHPDVDGVMFLEAAVSGRAQALVTANLRHCPESLRHGVTVLPPIEFVQRFVRVGR